MTEEQLVRRLDDARARYRKLVSADPASAGHAAKEVLDAERALAAARGEQYAEVIDIGFRWDVGAPLPHLITTESRAFLVCYVGEPDPAWDGTYVRVVSPKDGSVDTFGVIELWGCAAVHFGAPNDEALHGHPLHGRGLKHYAAHEVHDSEWIEEHIRINSVHPRHSEEPWRQLHHYFLAFHDEMFEALAGGIEGRLERSPLQPLLEQVLRELIQRPHRP